MARIRTIKPTLWDSEKLGRLSVLARLSFIGLISLADDEGRGRGEIRFLIGHLHAYAEERVTEQDFKSALIELEAADFVAFYTVNGCRYYALPGWKEHQYIEKWRKSELPPVPKEHRLARLFFPSQVGNGSPPVTPPIIPGNGMDGKGLEGTGRDLKDAPAAFDFNGYRLQIGGEFKGVYVTSLPLATAKRALKEARPNKKDREALEAWIAAKESEKKVPAGS